MSKVVFHEKGAAGLAGVPVHARHKTPIGRRQ